ncbi:MAG: DUF1071 domain-containing protein [Polaromonas sp.]|uniref:Sak single strand annealing protein n=1 Tax=Polaromonas sp. TaxID=1869339 RepID=UPI002489B7E0|nr:DUF1071 domain-containing protein [Polaromonas sp.]MDI1238652.1 DUF1071 domain-containing protein [Polaromonas sp.]
MEQQPQGNSFVRLSNINVASHVERKGNFCYLSWPFAVSELRKADPLACWEVIRFNGLPYLATETGFYVEVAVTVEGVTLSQVHPVLDARNKPIQNPTAFDINTSIQRCLVKSIALHGLGLSVYAGEDLANLETAPAPTAAVKEKPASRQAAKAPATPTPLRQVPATIDAKQQARIRELIAETDADLARLLDYFSVENLGQIQANQYDRVIRSLEHKRAA